MNLLNIHEIAAIMQRSVETVRKDLHRNPQAVPPRVILPGTRLLRWRAEDVADWLQQHVAKGGQQ
jgi:predicted DNA-binding transcriptional regulator AlpA